MEKATSLKAVIHFQLTKRSAVTFYTDLQSSDIRYTTGIYFETVCADMQSHNTVYIIIIQIQLAK